MATLTVRRVERESARRFRMGEWGVAPEWISVKQAADLVGYDPEYIRQLMRHGKVKAEKLPGMREWLIAKASLQAYVKQMKQLGSDKYIRIEIKTESLISP